MNHPLPKPGFSTQLTDLLFIIGLLSAAVVTIALTFYQTKLCLVMLFGCALICVLRWHERRHLVLGLTGLILGPSVEWLAVQFELWVYAKPDLGGLPYWIATMWWMFPVAVTELVRAVTRRQVEAPGFKFSLLMLVPVVPSMCLLGNFHPQLALLSTASILGIFIHRRHTVPDLVMIAVCALLGTGAELFMVASEAWKYPAASFLGVPIWLPTGYGAFGMGIIGVGISFERLLVRRKNYGSFEPTDDMDSSRGNTMTFRRD